MRAFVAIDAPHHPAFEKACAALGALGSTVKSVPAPNLHLTLRFIGETSIPVHDLLMALETASAGHPPFTMVPTTAGAFPSWSRPSVVWIGFGDGGNASELVRSIDRVLSEVFSIGPESRPFSAHLTLARVKGPSRVGDMRWAAEGALTSLSSDHYSIPVSAMDLMSSTLTPKGPIYEEAGRVLLRG
jgi:2'-5' RNA ligase